MPGHAEAARLPGAPRRRPDRPPARGARAVLDLTVHYYRQFARPGDELALAPMSERALAGVLAELYPRTPRSGTGARLARTRA